MGNQFVKGWTNNHLTWVMVDSTDFATPESALSAATKIKIYGKVKGATGANFVSSGTGSLTNDIQHVGASALGIYTIALAKADLSDASAAWYDQYIISLSATGAAYQTLIVDGGIWISDLSAIASDIRSDVSDMHSDLIVMSGILSDTYSAVLLCQSLASDAHSAALLGASAASDAYSAAIVIQSRLSGFDSRLVSDVSDIRSMLTALSDAISDAHSDLGSKIGGITATLSASDMSDLRSAIAAGPAATITASDISDIASAVWAHTIGARVDSRILVAQSYLSDIRSDVSDMHSDLLVMSGILSDAYSALTAGVQLNASSLSDIRSAISAGPAATVTASDISDIASAVWANTIGARVDSRVRLIQSNASDAVSMLALISSDTSDIASRISSSPATKSQVASATFALFASNLSDITSAFAALSDAVSDLKSVVTVTGVQLNASSLSDIRSAVSAGPTGAVTASDISDIASAVWAYTLANKTVTLNSSDISDLRSAISAGAGATVTASDISDIASAVWAFTTRKLTSNISLNASDLSDIRSAITAGGGAATISASDISDIASAVRALIASDLSDILSAAVQTNSRALAIQSLASDIDSALSSQFTAGQQLNASSLSDIRSAVTAAALTASQVKVQIVNALNVDTYAEPGQGAPAATASIVNKLGHLYKLSRNKITQDATTLRVFADDGTTVDAKATVSDDGTTYTRSELVTGP